MDRGPEREHRQIQRYRIAVHAVVVFYMSASAVHAAIARGYTLSVNFWLLAVYIVHFVSLLYTTITLAVLKRRGRKYEAMHGTWIPSPVYIRLRLTL
ncbi:hypothetical protein PINS_up003111 [Pythium insidiosum]|nr:hypothetical protein PINS_up003111 [Pythium insidiosum]